MAAVLLRLAWLDALDGDAQPQPPDREPGEVEQGIGAGEGDAVVGADRDWQATLAEQPLEGGEGGVFAGGFERFAHQQEARGMVGDGQRVAIVAVAELELALEVGAPQLVRRRACGQRRAARTMPRAAAALDQPVAVENGMDGALGGDPDIAVEPPHQEFSDLAGAPVRLLALEPDDQALDLRRQLVGVAHRPPRAVAQCLQAVFLVAVEDLVAGLARDPELPASSVIASPSSSRATKRSRSSITEHSFHGINTSRQKAESVTHVSGTGCHLCLGPLTMSYAAVEVADSHSSMQEATLDSDRQDVYRGLAALYSFRRHSCLLMSLAVSACVMWPSLPYYAPTNIPVWMDHCMLGRYIARVFERDGVAIDLLSDPAVIPFRGTLRIIIPGGQTATFLDAHIETSSDGSTRQTIEFWSPWCQKPDRISGPRRVD